MRLYAGCRPDRSLGCGSPQQQAGDVVVVVVVQLLFCACIMMDAPGPDEMLCNASKRRDGPLQSSVGEFKSQRS